MKNNSSEMKTQVELFYVEETVDLMFEGHKQVRPQKKLNVR